MHRAALVILGVAAGIVALVLFGVAIVVATVDPNRFVAPLAARVKAATGRTLTIDGPADFKVSLEPTIVLPGVALEGAPWSKQPGMLKAKRIEAQIALLPLFSRRFDVVRLTLVEPVLSLETDAGGRGNWEFDTTQRRASPASDPSTIASAFGIASVEIRDGAITYRNGATGKVVEVSVERLGLHARDMQAPMAVEFRGRIDGVPVSLAGDLGAPDRWLRQQWPFPVALKGAIDGTEVKLGTKITRDGAATTLGDVDVAYGALAGTGSVRVFSDASGTRYAIDVAVPALSVDAVAAAPAAHGASAAKGSGTPARWIIPDTSLPLAPLAALEGTATITIGELTLRDGQRLRQVSARLTAHDGGLDVQFDVKSILGGTMQGRLKFDDRRTDAPAVRLDAEAQDIDLSVLATAAGIRREIRGGKVRANVAIDGRGATPHRIAASVSGTIVIVAGPASLGRSTVHGASALAALAGALDPMQSVDAATDLQCAVFRLPLTDGVAHIDRSIAIETGKVAASASGTLDFRDETLDLSVKPQLRQDIGVDVSQLASLVRIRGRFDKPEVGIDAAQSAQMIAKIGVLGATGGGLAVLGGALLASSGESSPAPCTYAMGGNAAKAKPARASPSDIGKALGKLLGR